MSFESDCSEFETAFRFVCPRQGMMNVQSRQRMVPGNIIRLETKLTNLEDQETLTEKEQLCPRRWRIEAGGIERRVQIVQLSHSEPDRG